MKKLVCLLFFAALLFGLTSPASAQEELFFGQAHNYSVTLRGNGEAVVMARVAFTNFTDNDLSTLKLNSKDSLNQLAAYQQVLPDVCEQNVYNKDTGLSSCAKYAKQNYYSDSSYYYYESRQADATYHKLNITQVGDEYTFDLVKPLAADTQGAILLAYRSKDFVTKKTGGLFKFNFTTLAAPVQISEARVAVSVDSELFLKGKKSTVNYTTATDVSFGMQETAGLTNKNLDKIASSIGRNGAINKSAKQLGANETFTVKGSYATTKLRLYAGRASAFIIVIAAIIAALFFAWKKSQKQPNEDSVAPPSSDLTDKDAKINLFKGLYLIWSVISALLIFLMSWSIQYLDEINWLRDIPNDMEFILGIGLVIIILFFAFLLFGIPLIMASKHGWRAFMATFIDILILSVIFFLILTAASVLFI